ncbi:MAG: chalcone isomerase family protein [Deltaproteobacteria bacterium]|nr:chalcone isomerase family protein [Deltaproteobacteria bacterium]
MPKKFRTLIYALILILLSAGAAGALTIKGVDFADRSTLNGEELTLNGAGIRKKFFLSIYACALYLPHPTTNAENAIQSDTCKQVIMHFIHSKVGRDKIVKGWDEGFFNNSQEKMNSLQPRIATFDAFFDKDLVSGDRVVISYIPEQGTTVTINETVKGTIPGRDFMEALWAIWLGGNPADSGMKDGMLGK